MTLTKEQLKYLVTAIATLDWKTNFYELCRILEIDPNNKIYAEEKWEQFHKLSAALNYFDLDSLMKLLEAYEQQKGN
ncbi:hypothetical protein C7H19_19280 [Aphanothece hegewaldii CCALA 016]|uniref:Uncharacterized protein n=1 Tax=Aphanothece hegewaldii CCALA 016 TaxID=2107694 RepID=A0A2T1LTB2_9CHRO|nr:hypothetical protein [Aphanothece hegewaldii]PSF33868.1 hypothetical protein C7H19_19280 [Aphanothece hegewaldii CCALA 016]